MTELNIDTINKEAKEQKQRIKYGDINKNTIANDYKEGGSDYNSDFEDDDKSYKTSDDSTIDGNNHMSDNHDQSDEDQQQHLNVLEINDIDEGDSNSKNEGVGDEEVGKENDPIQDDEDTGLTVHKIKEEDSAEENNESTEGDDVSIKIVDNEYESSGNNKPQVEPEEPAPQRLPAVQN